MLQMVSVLQNSTLLYGVEYPVCDLLPHGKFAEVLPGDMFDFDLRLSRSVLFLQDSRISGHRPTLPEVSGIPDLRPHEEMMDVQMLELKIQ